MDREYITRLFAQSLDQARTLAEPVACEDCATLMGGKHPAWLLGHLVVGADFAAQLCGDPREGATMDDRFTPGSAPTPERGAYPAKAQLISDLEAAHAHATTAFERAADEVLAQEFPMEEYRSFFPRVGNGVVYLLAHHEAYHLGQLQQWSMAMGLTPARAEG